MKRAKSRDTRSLLEEFRPRFIARTGICAGYKEKVALGDLVAATYAFHYEEGKVEVNEEGEDRFRPEWRTHGPTRQIVQYINNFTGWETTVAEMKQRMLGRELQRSERPKCLPAPVASGMAVEGNNPFPRLLEHNRKALFLDQEVAAFYQTLLEFPDLHFLAVKGVCDYGDPDKNDNYHEYAARASAIYLLYFLQKFFPEWEHYDLMPLTEDQVKNSSWKLIRTLAADSTTVEKQIARFQEQLENNQVASLAAHIPLLLGFLIQLSLDGVDLVQQRAGLYKQILDVWRQSRPQGRVWQVPPPDVLLFDLLFSGKGADADRKVLETILRLASSLFTKKRRKLRALAMLLYSLHVLEAPVQDWYVLRKLDDVQAIEAVLSGYMAALQMDKEELAQDAVWALAELQKLNQDAIVKRSLISLLPKFPVNQEIYTIDLPSVQVEHLIRALHHPSYIMVHGAAQLLAAAGEGREEVATLLLTSNDEQLLHILALPGEPTDPQFQQTLLRALQAGDPRIAIAAVHALQELDIALLRGMAPALQSALLYWTEHGEGAEARSFYIADECPTCGTEPGNARAHVSHLLHQL